MKKKPADFTGNWKGTARLHLGDDMSGVTKALLKDLRNTALNLIAFSALDKQHAKNSPDLVNMLTHLQRLDTFKIDYDSKSQYLRLEVEGQIAVYLPGKFKRRTK